MASRVAVSIVDVEVTVAEDAPSGAEVALQVELQSGDTQLPLPATVPCQGGQLARGCLVSTSGVYSLSPSAMGARYGYILSPFLRLGPATGIFSDARNAPPTSF